METVLNTTELLEHILSFLPMPQVLGKSRVSRTWKLVINGSPSLQDKLFLPRQSGQAEVIGLDHRVPNPTDVSPRLKREELELLLSIVDMPVYTIPIELNPLVNWVNQVNLHFPHEMTVHHPKPFHPDLVGLEMVFGKYSRIYVRHRFGTSSQTAQVRASWRKMYLTTPPISDVVIRVPTAVAAGSTIEPIRVNVHAEHGITLGLLRDRVEETLKKFRMKDCRHPVQKKKTGPLSEKDFAKSWGKQENVMFLVKDVKDITDDGLQ